MRALALIYSHRVPGFKETQIGFDPIQKRNSNHKRKVKTRLSVDRPVDCAGRPGQPRLRPCQSVDRAGRPLSATVDRAVDRANLVHVVHTSRPASSTSRPGGRSEHKSGLLNASFLASLISDLCANFLYSSISSLPHKWLSCCCCCCCSVLE